MSKPAPRLSTPSVPRKELASVTSDEVGNLLSQLGLGRHVATFKRMHIDGVTLSALKTEKDLEGELVRRDHLGRAAPPLLTPPP